ncbi:MFS transporter [Nocardiopsis sediminis]|uniref:MFS transporter n=1 Tax=Nocardiopsis sediminis TaxID=1778267 RepID=A0ABV8FSI1_9ACTN
MAADDRQDPEPNQSAVRRAIAAAAIGNCTEWFDFGVYAYVATMVGAAFFPSGDPAIQTLSAFGVFAVSFLLRPLGSIFFGPLGDRIGRQRVLAVTIFLMAGATFVIGCLPTHAQIGVAAPILFLMARMVQGFATGGEYGGAATFIAEYSPDKRRGFLGSWLEFGTLAGFALGASIPTVLTLTLGEDAMFAWGWRIPFLIAGPLGAIGLYLRKKLEDTPAFREISDERKIARSPLRTLIRHNWRMLLMLVGIVIVLNVGNYVLLTYMETYLAEVLSLPRTVALMSMVVVMVAMMGIILPVGALTDRVGRKPLLASACVSYIVLAVPAFLLIHQGTLALTITGLALLALCQVQLLGTIPSALPALFPTPVRYGAFSIGYNISTALFGGTAPFIIQALVTGTGNQMWPAYYLMAAAVISLGPVLLSPETAGRPLLKENPARAVTPVKPIKPT